MVSGGGSGVGAGEVPGVGEAEEVRCSWGGRGCRVGASGKGLPGKGVVATPASPRTHNNLRAQGGRCSHGAIARSAVLCYCTQLIVLLLLASGAAAAGAAAASAAGVPFTSFS